jgi:hypothetical protein
MAVALSPTFALFAVDAIGRFRQRKAPAHPIGGQPVGTRQRNRHGEARSLTMDSLPTGSIHPWLSGSLAAILDSRAALLLRLGEHHDRHLAEHAARAHEKLQLQIAAERQWETREHRGRDERFE